MLWTCWSLCCSLSFCRLMLHTEHRSSRTALKSCTTSLIRSESSSTSCRQGHFTGLRNLHGQSEGVDLLGLGG